jgi:predicted Holliday junction resolvase-like endonuclease
MTLELYLAIGILSVIIVFLIRAHLKMQRKFLSLLSDKQSLSTKYGRMSEQFMPVLELYPYDRQRFRFIGSPVDGVQFNDDSIVFVEFKAADSKLTPDQKRIRQLVEDKKVGFKEIRLPSPEK